MKDLEDLSRMLSGELSAEEEVALRARIAAEPALARAWAEMQALPGALGALPLFPAPRRRRPSPAWLLVPLALAAGLLLAPRAPTRLTIGVGEQRIEGRVNARVGEVEIDLDGAARVSVEPPAAAVRDKGVEDPPMRGSHIIAALGGAALTVAVYEGRATIHAPNSAPVTLEPGQSWSRGPADPHPDAPPPTDTPPASLPEALVEIARLREELDRARVEQAIARGQLALETGTPVPWPEGLPAAAQPGAFEAALREALAASGAGELVGVDCEEFPCIAAIRAPNAEDGWEKPITASVGELAKSRFEGPVAVLNAAHVMDKGAGPTALMGVTLYPPDAVAAEGLDTRIRHRLDGLLQDLSEDEDPALSDPPPAP